jgi:hypothetical protein
VRDILGVRYSSQLLSVAQQRGCAVIHRRRLTLGPGERRIAEDVHVHLDRVSADRVAAEAGECGLQIEPHMFVPATERYLGSTVVLARAGG